MRLLLFAFLCSSLTPALPAELYRVLVQSGARAKMRDGVQLVSDIYRPDASGKFPVLLERTPYNRAGSAEMGAKLAAHGYVAVSADYRLA